MPRKSTKTTENTMTVNDAINTPLNFQFDETAEKLGIGEPALRERLEAKLDNPDVHLWDNIPVEHQVVIDAIARDLESESSVRRLTSEQETPQLPPQPEPLVLEEEVKPVKKGKGKSSALTQKKTKAIAKGREASQQTQQGVKQTLARLQAQEGIKDAANAGTTYLQAFQATLNQVKGQGLTVLAAEMIRDLNADSDFNPDDILAEYGIEISADTQEALMEQLAPMLGKSQEATQEVLETAWGNGIDLQVELAQLEGLMSIDPEAELSQHDSLMNYES